MFNFLWFYLDKNKLEYNEVINSYKKKVRITYIIRTFWLCINLVCSLKMFPSKPLKYNQMYVIRIIIVMTFVILDSISRVKYWMITKVINETLWTSNYQRHTNCSYYYVIVLNKQLCQKQSTSELLPQFFLSPQLFQLQD